MRLGAHAFLWVSTCSTDALLHAVHRAREATLDFVEIPLLNPEALDLNALRNCLHEQGVSCTCSLVLPPEASLPRTPRKAERFLLQAVEAAAWLGSPILTGVLYGKLGEDLPPEPAVLTRVAKVLKRVAQAAAQRGVQLGIEPVNRYETSLINTAEQALELIDMIAEPNVFLHLDTYHMTLEERGFRTPILKAGGRLRYVHLSESHRGEPGTGNVRWEEVFSALAEVKFAGDMALEIFLTPSPDLARATRIWRAPSAPPQDVVPAATAFFRELARRYHLA